MYYFEFFYLSLLLIFMLELAGAGVGTVHVLAACLVLGRLSHAYGVSRSPEDFRFRVLGMVLTFTALAASALRLLFASASAALA